MNSGNGYVWRVPNVACVIPTHMWQCIHKRADNDTPTRTPTHTNNVKVDLFRTSTQLFEAFNTNSYKVATTRQTCRIYKIWQRIAFCVSCDVSICAYLFSHNRNL